MSFPQPTKVTGKVILKAEVTAKEGKADELQVLLAAIRARAESSVEPDCHTYRTARGEGPGNENKFFVFEEYSLPNGIKTHLTSAEFQALGADCVADLSVGYFEEFTS